MTKRIFRSICGAAAAVFLASLLLIMGVLYSYFSREQMEQLQRQTRLTAKAVEMGGLPFLESLDRVETESPEKEDRFINSDKTVGLENREHRITWIDADGAVLFDNRASSAQMENHLERQEIQDAIKSGMGTSVRYSVTLTEKQFYCAQRLTDGTVLRMSVSWRTWWSLILGMLQPVFLVIGAAVLLSLFLADRLSRKIVKPLNELDLDDLSMKEQYAELEPLMIRIKSQQRQLNRQRAELERKREEFETITKNMTEGILLLNKHGAVLSMNEAASRLLGVSRYCVGKDLFLFHNSSRLQELIREAGGGKARDTALPIGEISYEFHASPVMSQGAVSGIVLIIFDMTEKEKAEQIRREFTANVSHELKTPLQSISGCAELLAEGLVKPEDVPRFSCQIYGEAKRMTALVEDILHLSRLDEGAVKLEWETVDLRKLCEKVLEELEPAARKAGVSLEITGTKGLVQGDAGLLEGIVRNLCDNAVKYNREGGSVILEVQELGDQVRLSVTDTGIGILPQDQERIFERFYRVDKSRSREVGGTGLGLSIVKHAAKLHHAEIQVESMPGEGTRVSLDFPHGMVESWDRSK